VLSSGGVYALDPQAPHVALAPAAVTVFVLAGLQ
jgi:hypothetical protein